MKPPSVNARIAGVREASDQQHPLTKTPNWIVIYFSSRKARSIASARLQPPTARRRTMNRIISAVLTASALIFGVFLPRRRPRISWERGRSFQSRLSRTARKPIFWVPIRKAKRRARLTATFRSSSPVRNFQSSHPTIARRNSRRKQGRRAGEYCLLRHELGERDRYS